MFYTQDEWTGAIAKKLATADKLSLCNSQEKTPNHIRLKKPQNPANSGHLSVNGQERRFGQFSIPVGRCPCMSMIILTGQQRICL